MGMGYRRASRIALIGAAALAIIVPGTSAKADPVTQSTYTSTYSTTCMNWYDTVGTEQGYVSLCGTVSDYGYGVYRNVTARRSVSTCDTNGTNCTDAYSEQYSGPAQATEFAMDAIAGTATFNITLAGESDTCPIQATAHATDTYTGSSPYPYVWGYLNPGYPFVGLQSGDTTYTLGASTNPNYLGAGFTDTKHTRANRAATGSGSVCNWVQTQTAGWAYMTSDASSSASTYVYPGSPPVPVPVPAVPVPAIPLP